MMALLATLTVPTFADAARAETVSSLDMSRRPSAFVGERVTLPAIGCVEQKDSYVCVAKAGGSLIAIDAVILGDGTDIDTSQHVDDYCKGSSNLDSSACSFDATFVPTSFVRETASTPSGDDLLIRFYVRTIDLVVHKTDQPR